MSRTAIAALGTGLQDDANLLISPSVKVWMDLPPADSKLGGVAPAPAQADVILRLTDGPLVEER